MNFPLVIALLPRRTRHQDSGEPYKRTAHLIVRVRVLEQL